MAACSRSRGDGCTPAFHLSSLAHACAGLGLLYIRQGNLTQAQAVLRRGLALCDAWDLRLWRPRIEAPLGYAWVLEGRLAEALPLLEEAVALGQSVSQIGQACLWQSLLAEAYWLAGRAEDM